MLITMLDEKIIALKIPIFGRLIALAKYSSAKHTRAPLVAVTKRAAKAAEERKDAADKAIRALLGDALIGTVSGAVRVELKPIVRHGVDTDLLKSLFLEAYETCKTQSEHKRLYTK